MNVFKKTFKNGSKKLEAEKPTLPAEALTVEIRKVSIKPASESSILDSSSSNSNLAGFRKDFDMTSYNHSSSYNRTYERKVIEEGNGSGSPLVRIQSSTCSSPLNTIKSTFGSAFPSGSSSFITPHNYHFGTSTSGSFHSSDDSLSVTLDVSAFAPEDLKVTVIGNQIVIEGKHPEKQDDLGSIERFFVRKFALPRNALPDSVRSNLSAEGQLIITAEAPKIKDNSPARTIPIKIVNTPSSASTNSTAQNNAQQL